MKLFNKIKNMRKDCSHLVRVNEDGSYDVTKVYTHGMIAGCIASIIGVTLAHIINNKFRK